MIDGVIVLSESNITEWIMCIYVLGWVSLVVGFLLSLLCFVLNYQPGLIVTLIILGIGVVLIFVAACAPKNETARKQYKVLITDTCDAHDLLTKYEIISNEGDIWIIEDKEGK